MPAVTYKGPTDSSDPTTHIRLPAAAFGGEEDLHLGIGQKVDVPQAAAKKLESLSGHEFKVSR